MIDAREQIYALLKGICSNTALTFPEDEVELPLLTYGEVTNVHVGKWHDRLEYQVDVWHNDIEELVALAQAVDDGMSGLGFTRTYVTPDSSMRAASGLYHKAMNYLGHIDTYHMNFLKEM